MYIYMFIFFQALRAAGILQILQSDWFHEERAVFYDLAPAAPCRKQNFTRIKLGPGTYQLFLLPGM